MKTKSINQNITFSGSPEAVYQLIMDPKKHAAFTGSDVIMSNEIDGRFNAFDGYCQGYNIELVKDKKIVQAWHFEEDGWPDDHYSICTFSFVPEGKKTILNFTQTGVPEHKVDSLTDGWREFYWEPMEAYLKSNEN